MGTTIAGMSVLRLDDVGAAAAAPAVAWEVEEDLEEVSWVDEGEEEAAAADVMEAYSRGSVIILVRAEVTVLGTGSVRASVCVSTTVVKPEGASAETTEAMAVGSATMFVGTMAVGRDSVGFPMLAGRPSRSEAVCLLWRAEGNRNILPECMSGRSSGRTGEWVVRLGSTVRKKEKAVVLSAQMSWLWWYRTPFAKGLGQRRHGV